MKTIISTGQGRLHLIESARAIQSAGVETRVITGWVPPRYLPDAWLNALGRLLGHKKLAYGMRKRQPADLPIRAISGCALAEFLLQGLLLLARWGFMTEDLAKTWGWRFFGWQSRKFIRNADIFHVRSGAGQGGAIAFARQQGMKVVVDHSAGHPITFYQQLLKANKDSSKDVEVNPASRFWRLVLDDCHQADVILVNSTFVKSTFLENGFHNEQLLVAQLGIRSDFFGLKNGYEHSAPIKLLFTGSFSLGKGRLIIINSMSQLLKQKYSFQLDVVGSIPDYEQIPDWFINHPMINLHGHLPQDALKIYLQQADIYIFPSYCEGAAQSLNEAMAAGLPVIATRQSGSPLRHGENGLVIADDSPAELTSAILALFENATLRETLGRNATRTIREECTWEGYGLRVADLYATLLSGQVHSP